MLLLKLFVIIFISCALLWSSINGAVNRELNEVTTTGRDLCPLAAVNIYNTFHPGMRVISGRRKSQFYKPKSLIVVQCQTSTTFTTTSVCNDNGKWSKVVDCPPPNVTECTVNITLPNGSHNATLSTYSIGSRIHFACNDGYELDGPPIIICLAENKWTANVPRCNPNITKECILNVELSNGHHNGSTIVKYPIGTSIKFGCDAGYVLEGVDLITCSNEKKWTSTVPNCSSTVHNWSDPTEQSSTSPSFMPSSSLSSSSSSSSSPSPSSLSNSSQTHISFVIPIFFTFFTIFILIGLTSLYRWRQRRAKRKYWKSYFDNNAYRQSKTTITTNTDHHVRFLNWENSSVPVTDL